MLAAIAAAAVFPLYFAWKSEREFKHFQKLKAEQEQSKRDQPKRLQELKESELALEMSLTQMDVILSGPEEQEEFDKLLKKPLRPN
jgi:hypothetical protein